MFGPGISELTACALVLLPLLLLYKTAKWIVFVKAGRPGWAALIPFYSRYVLLDIVKKPKWWLVFMLLPPIGLVFSLIVSIRLAKAFRHGAGFALGLMCFGFIFYPILAFTEAEYSG